MGVRQYDISPLFHVKVPNSLVDKRVSFTALKGKSQYKLPAIQRVWYEQLSQTEHNQSLLKYLILPLEVSQV